MQAVLHKILIYIGLRKPDPADAQPNFNTRLMHGINKIALMVFVLAIVIYFVKMMLR